ncbi:hypothetical protein H0H81_008468 [Sphagnurus paluster]|uniref:Cytochrome P450 n=1 Tax=Sphagnurus paluster TaxID=117069 RepID=A0A9P7KLD7_9AGAR|nr:hypothetical protein H0H81_008468 [Sphagnurus paluster]
MFHRQFSQSAAPVHWNVQRKEAHALLRRLLDTPEDLIEHLRHNAASVIMNVTYGINISSKGDRYITIAEKALAVKYIPEWAPGAGFRRKAREWKKAVREMRDAPFETTMDAIKEGTASPSFVLNLFQELEAESKDCLKNNIEVVKGCAGMSYAGGTESTLSALSSFVLAIILYPEVQEKAQEELDHLLDHSRLPDFLDRDSLPYINAIVKEVLRWSPVAPLGLPHMASEDDEYNGYFIPAGTTVVGNTWAILHNPITFPNPSVFNPDRFLVPGKLKTSSDPSPLDPLSATFGYGRRICPGRYMAGAQLWISIACILAVFDIKCGVDEDGRPVRPHPTFTSGLIR